MGQAGLASTGDRAAERSGAAAEAAQIGAPFLGEIPLEMAIRSTSDAGTPVVASAPDGPHADRGRKGVRTSNVVSSFFYPQFALLSRAAIRLSETLSGLTRPASTTPGSATTKDCFAPEGRCAAG